MIAANLLPKHRRAARTRARRTRTWIFAIVLTQASCAALAMILAAAPAGPANANLDSELATAASESVRLNSEIGELESRRAANARSIAAVRATIDHPDWSALVARVVAIRPEGVSFTRWILRPDGSATLLTIEGEGPDLEGTTAFVIALERLGAFRRVTLLSARAKSANDVGTVFAIETEMGGGGAGP